MAVAAMPRDTYSYREARSPREALRHRSARAPRCVLVQKDRLVWGVAPNSSQEGENTAPTGTDRPEAKSLCEERIDRRHVRRAVEHSDADRTTRLSENCLQAFRQYSIPSCYEQFVEGIHSRIGVEN